MARAKVPVLTGKLAAPGALKSVADEVKAYAKAWGMSEQETRDYLLKVGVTRQRALDRWRSGKSDSSKARVRGVGEGRQGKGKRSKK